MIEGRIYQVVRGDDGWQYIPVVKIPNAGAREVKGAQAFLAEHQGEMDACTTVAEVRARWQQWCPAATWELDFMRWRGHETP